MPSLKEIKGRIGSVRSTLKITSAMKLVASAKLRKAQSAIENLLPYEQGLRSILAGVGGLPAAASRASGGKTVLVAFASNSSLCGGFNANVIREARARVRELAAQGRQVVVISVGRRMADAMAKAGYPSPADYTKLADTPSYEGAAALADTLIAAFDEGRFDRVELVYNHFHSTASQPTRHEVYLPFSVENIPEAAPEDFIVEPSREELIAQLVPTFQRLRIYTTLLDANAAEHAARTVAMQTATDNGNNLLQELTLEYNKSRQQKITSEILDLVGGTLQQ